MKRWATVLIIVAILVPGGVWASEMLSVDRCLDAGGVYDYGAGQCDRSSLHLPYIPFTARRRPLLLASVGVGVVGLLLYSRRKGSAAVA